MVALKHISRIYLYPDICILALAVAIQVCIFAILLIV